MPARYVPKVSKVNLAGNLQVFQEDGFVAHGDLPVVNVGINLVVYVEAAVVNVGRAYAGQVVIGNEGFGMYEASASFINLDTCLKAFFIV